jgi:ParB family transcriptional regulator, chromosome partitioning protein
VADPGGSHGIPGRGIGRGLASILQQSEREDGLREIAVDLVRPNPDQPRRELPAESLQGLADSIRERGVLQPLVVSSLPGGSWELIAGERRLRAARMAGLETVPAIVREAAGSERLELALIENVAREDLNPVDEARACATLVDDLGITKEELARRLGKSRVVISNLIRLLGLPDDVLALIESGALSEGHGRALLLCKDHDGRRELARRASTAGWSVRETERRAKDWGAPQTARQPKQPVVLHPDLADALGAAEDSLSAALGREVRVRPRAGRYLVSFELDEPREGIELAERLMRLRAA